MGMGIEIECVSHAFEQIVWLSIEMLDFDVLFCLICVHNSNYQAHFGWGPSIYDGYMEGRGQPKWTRGSGIRWTFTLYL